MKNERNCKIVQELLPNYIENLTNEEVNNYIEEHLENCDECKNILENMKKDLNSNLKAEDKEIDFLKKVKKKIRLLMLVLMSILILILVITWGNHIRKFIILSKISNQSNNNAETINNYYAKVFSVQEGNSLHIIESYVTNTELLTNMIIVQEDNTTRYSLYQDTQNHIYYEIDHNTKSITNLDENENIMHVGLVNHSDIFGNTSFVDKLLYTKNIKDISTTYCNGHLCYSIIFHDGTQIWVEKDTGLTLRYIENYNSQQSREYEYEYKFEDLKENILPDISDYTFTNKTER